MKVAIVGATGLVGGKMLNLLEEREFPINEIIPVASEKSIGKTVTFRGKGYPIVGFQEAIKREANLALFSAGGDISKEQAPNFAAVGTTVIDNSSSWRMNPTKKLIVPEVNASVLEKTDKIIANPNCSTIQMVVALNPLHQKYGIKRIVVSTYQSVSGTGQKGVNQLIAEEQEIANTQSPYPHAIHRNVIPHIDTFTENGYTKEEMKMINETRKIMGDDSIGISATTVRVPVVGGHSESINIEFHNDFDLKEVREILSQTPGVILQDNPSQNEYPLAVNAEGKDEVFVGRLRRDESQANTLNMWVVADNLRKGAATNAVQIAEYLLQKKWI